MMQFEARTYICALMVKPCLQKCILAIVKHAKARSVKSHFLSVIVALRNPAQANIGANAGLGLAWELLPIPPHHHQGQRAEAEEGEGNRDSQRVR
jgi:hypothetical protein